MSNEDYMLESLSQILDDMEIKIPYEQQKEIANALVGSEENKSMYMGYDCIPHPSLSEIEKLQNKIKQLEKDRDWWSDSYRKNVAARWKCDVSQVTIEDDGKAYVQNKGPTR